MPKLKLTYFDRHAGRGEVARMALFIGGVAGSRRAAASSSPKAA